jgi:hypothetical protein
MPENFTDAQKIKRKRANSSMGIKEIKEIPTRQRVPEPIVTRAPIKASPPGPVTVTAPPVKGVPQLEKTEQSATTPQDKLTIQKGFLVGKTEDGKIVFKPFGSPEKIELIGFVEYAKAVSSDLLNELANTSTHETHAIKDGITAALHGIKVLLSKQAENHTSDKATA